jgi:hypothetical protein
MWALTQFRGENYTEPHIVPTASAITSADMILADPVLDNNTVNITVASNNVNDAPVPFAYSPTNRKLTINGLNPSDTRTLTVVYQTPRLDPFTDTAARFFPAFLIIGCIAAIGGAVYGAVHH